MNIHMATVVFAKDPKKVGTDDKSVVKFTGGSQRAYSKSDEPEVDWLPFTAFGKTADFILKYFKKGSKALVTTHPQQNIWTDKDGNKHYDIVFIVENVEFFGSKQDGSGSVKTNTEASTPAQTEAPAPVADNGGSGAEDSLDDVFDLGF